MLIEVKVSIVLQFNIKIPTITTGEKIPQHLCKNPDSGSLPASVNVSVKHMFYYRGVIIVQHKINAADAVVAPCLLFVNLSSLHCAQCRSHVIIISTVSP